MAYTRLTESATDLSWSTVFTCRTKLSMCLVQRTCLRLRPSKRLPAPLRDVGLILPEHSLRSCGTPRWIDDRQSKRDVCQPKYDVEQRAKLTCPQLSAWYDLMPRALAPGQTYTGPIFYVVGKCTFPTPGFSVELKRHTPPSFVPTILLPTRNGRVGA